MTLDPKALETASEALCATPMTATPAEEAERVITAYLDALASRSAIVEEPMAVAREAAWVIENTLPNQPEYFCGGKAGRSFSPDHMQAIRFIRREDAVACADFFPISQAIRAEAREHVWLSPPSPQPHTGRAGVTEEGWKAAVKRVRDQLGQAGGTGTAAVHNSIVEREVGGWILDAVEDELAALNAALTVEPEAGEVTRK